MLTEDQEFLWGEVAIVLLLTEFFDSERGVVSPQDSVVCAEAKILAIHASARLAMTD